MKQRGITIVTEILPDRKGDLELLLRSSGDQIQNGASSAFSAVLPLHSLSFFIVDGVDGSAECLVCESNIDGSPRDFLAQLVTKEGPRLISIYLHCVGFGDSQKTPHGMREYLERAMVRNNLHYVGAAGHTTERIQSEAAIAARVTKIVQDLGPPQIRRSNYLRGIWAALPSDMRERVRRSPPMSPAKRGTKMSQIVTFLLRWWWRVVLLAGCLVFVLVALQTAGVKLNVHLTVPRAVLASVFAWAKWLSIGLAAIIFGSLFAYIALLPRKATTSLKQSWVLECLWRTLKATVRALPAFAVGLGIVGLYLWRPDIALWALFIIFGVPVLLGLLYVSLSVLHTIYERRETFHDLAWDPQREAQMRAREDRGPQNHFIGVTTVKDTPLRLFTVRFVLRVFGALIPIAYPVGDLSGIKSIHFARWTLLPRQEGTKQRRLLFVGHYDGSWGGYLGDFVANAERGMTAIWGNTRGCPRHTFLFNDGVRDEQRFKCYARSSQVESLLWYARDRQLTLRTIQRNAQICGLLAQAAPGSTGPICEERVDAFMRLF